MDFEVNIGGKTEAQLEPHQKIFMEIFGGNTSQLKVAKYFRKKKTPYRYLIGPLTLPVQYVLCTKSILVNHMSRNGQTRFRNLAANAARLLKCV